MRQRVRSEAMRRARGRVLSSLSAPLPVSLGAGAAARGRAGGGVGSGRDRTSQCHYPGVPIIQPCKYAGVHYPATSATLYESRQCRRQEFAARCPDDVTYASCDGLGWPWLDGDTPPPTAARSRHSQPRRCLKRTAHSYALCALRSVGRAGQRAAGPHCGPIQVMARTVRRWAVRGLSYGGWSVVCCMLLYVACCCMLRDLLYVACSVACCMLCALARSCCSAADAPRGRAVLGVPVQRAHRPRAHTPAL